MRLLLRCHVFNCFGFLLCPSISFLSVACVSFPLCRGLLPFPLPRGARDQAHQVFSQLLMPRLFFFWVLLELLGHHPTVQLPSCCGPGVILVVHVFPNPIRWRFLWIPPFHSQGVFLSHPFPICPWLAFLTATSPFW